MVLLCIGGKDSFEKFTQTFTREHSIEPYNITVFDQALSIASVRIIMHSLSFSQPSKVFIISGSASIEAQNALLKSLEELQGNVHFLFWAEKDDVFLKTIQSRASIIRLVDNSDDQNNTYSLLNTLSVNSWEATDRIVQLVDDSGASALLPVLREYLLEGFSKKSSDIHFRYALCKKMISAIPLMENNNINSRVLIERVFERETTY